MNYKDKLILLVEDQEAIALVQQLSLEEKGYNIEHVSSGEDAIKYLDSDKRADLVLMDIDLGPGLNGIETTEKIMQKYDIPVLFLSGHTETEIVKRTEEVSSYGYVVKDSGITVLDASIKMAFKLHAARQHDHNARKEAENNLKISENKLKDLLDHMLAGFVIVEPIRSDENKVEDIRFLDVNNATEAITGINKHDFIGKTSTEIFSEVEKSYFKYHEEVLRTGKPIRITESFSALGKHFELSIYKYDQQRLAIFYNDVTEQILSRKKLEASEEQYRSLFHYIAQEIHFWQLVRNENGEIITWKLIDANPAALKAWKKKKSDIIGKTPEQIFTQSTPTQLFMPIVKRIFTENKPYSWNEYFEETDQNLWMTSVPFGEYFVTTGVDINTLDDQDIPQIMS